MHAKRHCCFCTWIIVIFCIKGRLSQTWLFAELIRVHLTIPALTSIWQVLLCYPAYRHWFIFQLRDVHLANGYRIVKRGLQWNWAVCPFKLRMRVSPKTAIKFKQNKTNKNASNWQMSGRDYSKWQNRKKSVLPATRGSNSGHVRPEIDFR